MHPLYFFSISPFKFKVLFHIRLRAKIYLASCLLISNTCFALDDITLQLNNTHKFQFAGYYAAVEQGFYRDVGLNVSIIESKDNKTALSNVLSGKSNYGVGSSSLLLDRHAGKPIVVLAVIFQHSPLVLLAAEKEIKEGIHNIAGKRVILSNEADELKALLRQENIAIEKIPTSSHHLDIEDFVSGKVAAISANATHDTQILDDKGFKYRIFSPRSVGIDFYGDNLFTSEHELVAYPKRVDDFRKASIRGWKYAFEQPDNIVDLILNKYSKSYSKEQLQYEATKAFSFIDPLVSEIGRMNKARWLATADTYIELGMLSAAFSFDGFLYEPIEKTAALWWYLGLTVLICLLFLTSVAQFRQRERERKINKEAMQFNNLLLSAQQEASMEGMLTIDNDGNIISINQRLIDVLEIDITHCKDLIGNKLLNVFVEKVIDYQQFSQKIQILDKVKGVTSVEEVTLKGGKILEYYSSSLIADDGQFFGELWSFRDITERKESDQLIWNQANLDFLTKLPNRYMLFDRLALQLQSAERTNTKVAVLFLDLDKFKEINDTLGHSFGDSLLKETAKRLKKCVRNTDIVSRLGGDEFTVVISNLNEVHIVERITEKIINALSQPFCFGSETATISTSVGISLFPDDGLDVDTLMTKSDQAMYVIKENGRNGYQYFTEQMQTAAAARQSLSYDLKQALNKGELQLYYQPIIDLSTGDITTVEALIRWLHPRKGMISPLDFISVAEDIGMINEIGDWVFEHACRQLYEWRNLYNKELKVSINVSLSQFCKRKDFSQWQQVLDKLDLAGDALIIEIKECTLMEAEHSVYDKLEYLSSLGINIALDDFGTGYSSLSYLSNCNIKWLKIDESIISKLTPNSRHLSLCEGIIAMVHKLGIKVIAEGIETREQLEVLTQAECDLGQGYYIKQPLTTAEFEKLLYSPHTQLIK